MKKVFERIRELLQNKSVEHTVVSQKFSAHGFSDYAAYEENRIKGLEEAIKIVNRVEAEFVTDTNVRDIKRNLDKLAEYEKLEEQGLFLRLPCKVGTDVYYILGIPNETPCCIEKTPFSLSNINKIGKTMFLTEEEAQEVLSEKECKNGNQDR